MTVIQRSGTCKKSWPFILYILTNKIKGQKCPISSYFNSLKFCWEHARSERPSELQLFNNYPLVDESVFVSHVFVLLITERYCTLDSYLSIINKINTHETNTDSSTAKSSMFKLSSLFENSVTKVGGAETSKFRPIPQFGDFCRDSIDGWII